MSLTPTPELLALLQEGEFIIQGPEPVPENEWGDDTNLCSRSIVPILDIEFRVGYVDGKKVLYFN